MQKPPFYSANEIVHFHDDSLWSYHQDGDWIVNDKSSLIIRSTAGYTAIKINLEKDKGNGGFQLI